METTLSILSRPTEERAISRETAEWTRQENNFNEFLRSISNRKPAISIDQHRKKPPPESFDVATEEKESVNEHM